VGVADEDVVVETRDERHGELFEFIPTGNGIMRSLRLQWSGQMEREKRPRRISTLHKSLPAELGLREVNEAILEGMDARVRALDIDIRPRRSFGLGTGAQRNHGVIGLQRLIYSSTPIYGSGR
jgi:hypothetical protein